SLENLAWSTHAWYAAKHATKRGISFIPIQIQALNLVPQLRLVQRSIRIRSSQKRGITLGVYRASPPGDRAPGNITLLINRDGQSGRSREKAQFDSISARCVRPKATQVWMSVRGPRGPNRRRAASCLLLCACAASVKRYPP